MGEKKGDIIEEVPTECHTTWNRHRKRKNLLQTGMKRTKNFSYKKKKGKFVVTENIYERK